MKPYKHNLANHDLMRPSNWDEKVSPCESLPAHWDRERGMYHSWWKVPFRERLAILFGAPVRLTVASASHPAVALEAQRN